MLIGLPTLVPLLVRERHNVVVVFTMVYIIVYGVALKGGCNGVVLKVVPPFKTTAWS